MQNEYARQTFSSDGEEQPDKKSRLFAGALRNPERVSQNLSSPIRQSTSGYS